MEDEHRLDRNEVLEHIKWMEPSEHTSLFYSSREDKRFVLFSYLKAGLVRNEAAVYVASQETPDQIIQAMRAIRIDTDALEKSGALYMIHSKGRYVVKGRFSVSKTMEFWKRLYEKRMTDGFTNMRVAGEMTYFHENRMEKEVIEYKKTLGRRLALPGTAICAYDHRLLAETREPDLFLELIKAHGAVIVAEPQGGVLSWK